MAPVIVLHLQSFSDDDDRCHMSADAFLLFIVKPRFIW